MPHDDDSLMINSQMRALYEKAIASLEDGSQFAEYTIVRLLGRGGMGAVYEARHVTLERSYAIKVLPYEFMARRDALERFENEARVMANLEHPNIVRVDDFRQTQGLYWLRMELARGDGSGAVSLQDLADRNGGVVDQELLLDLMTDVLGGIGYAHEKGVIHRDLKPANILLFPKPGGGLTAKVADYGLVKLLGDEFLRSRVTHSVKMSMGGNVPEDKQGTSTRALLGTWEYMAPEQQQGRDVKPSSDVYSLGLICYKLLTGRKLSMRTPSQIDKNLVREWDACLFRSLEEDPADRYADAAEMLAALHSVRNAMGMLRSSHQVPVTTPPKDTQPARASIRPKEVQPDHQTVPKPSAGSEKTPTRKDNRNRQQPTNELPSKPAQKRSTVNSTSPTKPAPKKAVSKIFIIIIVCVLGIGIISAIAIPSISRSRLSANESSMIGSLRTLAAAQTDYNNNSSPHTYTESLSCLGSGNGAGQVAFIDPYLASGLKGGYNFTMQAGQPFTMPNNTTAIWSWSATAWPIVYGSTGIRTGYIDESGVVRAMDNHGRPGDHRMPEVDN